MAEQLSHNDNPSAEDQLYQNDFIKDIANVISHCTPPKGIGINGYWGTGKTSSLIQLHYELTGTFPSENKKPTKGLKITPVWFEAWRHQHEPIPIIALLHEIRARINLWNQFLSESQKLMGVVSYGVLAAFDETIKMASGGLLNKPMAELQASGEKWEESHYQTNLQSQHISELLEEAITKALGRKGRKLVIFIDDLDRCSPNTALKLLEGIKVYLNLKNCVIIFGMDQRQIERALVKALELNDENADHQAREYLEKICQDIYHLPLPDKKSKCNYLQHLLANLNLGEDKKTHITELKKVLNQFDCLPANPRKIKALSNRLSTVLRKNVLINDNALINKVKTKIRREYGLLIVMTIIYTFHRQLNEQLEKDPSYINTIFTFAQGASSNIDKDPVFEPMKGIKLPLQGSQTLPTNPSDSNVFRIQGLLTALQTADLNEVTRFLGK